MKYKKKQQKPFSMSGSIEDKESNEDIKQLKKLIKDQSLKLAELKDRLTSEITDRKAIEEQYKNNCSFERLIFRLSTKFINLPVSCIDSEIDNALEIICEFWKLDNIILIQNIRNKVEVTHSFSNEETEKVSSILHHSCPWCMEEIFQGRTIYFSPVQELPDEAKIEREIFLKSGVKSVIAAPLKGKDFIFGGLFTFQVSSSKSRPFNFLDSFYLVSDIFAGALSRKKSEELLRDSEERYRLLVETMTEGVLIIDEKDNLTYFNPRLTEIMGYSFNELQGSSIYTYVDNINGKILKKHLEKRRKGIAKPYEIEWKRKDGSGILTIVSPRAIFDSDGVYRGSMSVITDITWQKKVEEQLKKEKELGRKFLDVAEVLIVSLSLSGEVTLINRKGCEILGYSKEEITGKKWFDKFIPPDIRDKIRNVFAGIINGDIETFRKYESRVLTKNGGEKTIFWNNSLLKDKTGKIIGTLSSGKDVTDKRAVENALKKSEIKYKNLFDTAPVGIFIANKESEFTHCNSRLVEIFGCKCKEDIIGKFPWDFFPATQPDGECSKKKVIRQVAKALNGELQLFELCNLRLNGTPVDVEVSLKMIFSGEVLLQGFIRDITERKIAENILRESEMKYRTLFETANDAIYILKDDIIVDCNNKSLEIYGCSREDFIGKTPHYFSPARQPDGRDSEEEARKVINTALEGKSLFFEWLHSRFDGSLFYAEVSLNRIIISGEPLLLAVNRDINERKLAELERGKLEREIRHSQKMRAIGTLAGGIAHDFNNILTILIGNAELALEEIPGESRAEEFLRGILKAGKRAKNLVRQILAFSRQAEEERSPVIISFIVKEALALLKSTIPSTIKILEEISAKSTMIFANATQIHQVIMNLCINAFHAMEEKGGTLVIGLEEIYFGLETCPKGLEPGLYAELSVSDTGYGIDENIIERIFEPYFTTKGQDEGTGLGLSVVHGIVKSHEGDIRVYSKPGRGTTFEVYFPVIEVEKAEECPSPDLLPPGKGERCLVVDDESSIVHIIKNFLEGLGYKVSGFSSSIEALECFRENKESFSIIITDQTMPGLTGIEFSKEILKIRPDIPIVLCTGYSKVTSEIFVKAAGIKEFLKKPISRKKLAETVRAVLDEEM